MKPLPPFRDPNAPYSLVTTYAGHTTPGAKPLRVPVRFASAEERAAVVEGMRRCYALKPYVVRETARDPYGVCALAVEAVYAGGSK